MRHAPRAWPAANTYMFAPIVATVCGEKVTPSAVTNDSVSCPNCRDAIIQVQTELLEVAERPLSDLQATAAASLYERTRELLGQVESVQVAA